MIRQQFILPISDEIIVDNFAGGGGASTGIELALGRHVDIAVNHDPEAVRMHEANHPQTLHLCESVFDVDPVAVTAGRRVGLAWFSPDCTHFSKARGTKPRKKSIRGLAWVILRWAALVRPRVIFLENVEEFLTWGPLAADGQPCPINKGRTFRTFRDALTTGIAADNPDIPEIVEILGPDFPLARLYAGLGYRFEHKEERASDHGAPTIRKRLFGIARCDSAPIVWPSATHGDPKRPDFRAKRLKPWRTAAECIDWTLPCPSIFERKKPLAPATCRRVAKGIMRHVVNDPAPFIIPLTHHGEGARDYPLDQPVQTVTGANRGEMAMVAPTVINTANSKTSGRGPNAWSPTEPLRTVTSANGFAVVAPSLIVNTTGNPGGKVGEPLKTICAGGGHHALVSAFLAKHYGGVVGQDARAALGTITATDHHSLVAATLTKFQQNSIGQPPTKPLDTCMAGAPRFGVVAAHLTKYHGESSGASASSPAPTVTANSYIKRPGGAAPLGLVAAHLSKLRGDPDTHAPGQRADEPAHTVSAQGNHFAEVRAFLVKYYGNEKEAHELRDPIGTVTTKDRFGLVTIAGEEFAIVDIGLRMLAPRELFNAQGFPASYIIGDNPAQGLTLTKTAQVRMCGNSVCPPMAAALVRANVPELAVSYGDEREAVG